jgi:dTDP-glucose 4,6-dehydratase
MSQQTILVTGAAGFIGSNFVHYLLENAPDVTIVNLDLLTYAGNLSSLGEALNSERHHFVRGNIGNAELVRHLLEHYQVDGIINFAAESHVDRSITGPQVFAETNVNGTLNLLWQARAAGVKRFLQVSTDEVYGSLGDHGMFREDTPLAPNSPYSASKASADHFVQAFNHTYGMDTLVTRCSNNYGPYQFPEKMIPLMINNARHDQALPVYGDGLHVRDWLYVMDHCSAIWKVFCAGRSGEVYNVGGNNEKTNLEVITTILDALGKPHSLIKYVQDRPGHDRRYAIDASKIRRELGWEPQVKVADGIAMVIDWYLAHQEWMDQIISGAYQQYYAEMYAQR